MTEPIRVLHFADIHIGMENFGRTDPASGLSTRVLDFLRRMEEMIEYATANDVDLVVFAGDAFKTRNPNPTYQREFAYRIQDLANIAPVVMLVGNHDLPITSSKASSLEIYDTLRVHNVLVADTYEVQKIPTKRGDVIMGFAPYPIRARLMENIDVSGTTIAETDELLHKVMTDLLEELAQDADALDPENEIPRILTGHFTVSGAIWGSERSVMLGRDVQVSLSSLADPRWDYVALGHIHKFQNLTHGRDDVPPVIYSGSMERIDFGEGGDPKGFCWVELERNSTTWTFEEVEARPFITLKCDCRDLTNPTQEVIELIKEYHLGGAIVRIDVKLSPEIANSLNEIAIRDALRNAGAFQLASIRKDVEYSSRARLATNPEELSHLELLEEYLISREFKPKRRAELLAAAEEIMKPDRN